MKRHSKKDQADLYKEWEKSGESRKSFALRKGISPSTFHYWIDKFSKVSSQYKSLFVKILIGILVISRFLFLEQDLPSRKITAYCDFDQYWYTLPALSFYDSGEVYNSYLIKGESDTRVLFDLFENIVTLPFLYIFGDNFFGFKIPVIILSLIAILAMIKSSQLTSTNKQFLLLIALFLSTDFLYFITSRIHSPTSISIFGFTILIYLYIKYIKTDIEEHKRNLAVLLGIWSTFIVFFIYIFNLFTFAAIGICFLLEYFGIFKRSYKKGLIFFSLGAAIGFLVYNIFGYVIFEQTVFDLYQNLKGFSGSEDFRFKNEIDKNLIPKIKTAITSNFLISLWSKKLSP